MARGELTTDFNEQTRSYLPARTRSYKSFLHHITKSQVVEKNLLKQQVPRQQKPKTLTTAQIDTNELTGPGTQHEEIGPQLLLESGFQEAYARFARTHAQWDREPSVQLEDVLVAFADTIWKGKRDEALEQEIAQQIAKRCQEETWQVYMKLDDIACDLAKDAHDRILWQGNHTL